MEDGDMYSFVTPLDSKFLFAWEHHDKTIKHSSCMEGGGKCHPRLSFHFKAVGGLEFLMLAKKSETSRFAGSHDQASGIVLDCGYD